MSDSLTIVALAVDISPAQIIEEALAHAVRDHHRVISCLNVQDVGELNLFAAGSKPDVLVTAMSSAIALRGVEVEIEHGERAAQLKIPHLVVSDTHQSWGRLAAKGRVGHAHALVVSPAEVAMATEDGWYGSAKYLSMPSPWHDCKGIKPLADRLAGELPTFYAEGFKSKRLSTDFLEAVIAGGNRAFGSDWALVFRSHPNESNEDLDESKEEGRKQAETEDVRRKKAHAAVSHLVPFPEGMELARVAATADGVCLTSGPQLIPVGCINRLPIVYWNSDSIVNRMKVQIGFPKWAPVEAGAVWEVWTEEEMADRMKACLDPDQRADLAKKQAQVYPDETLEVPAEELLYREIIRVARDR